MLSLFIIHTPTTVIYTLSLHDALPISAKPWRITFCSSGNRSCGMTVAKNSSASSRRRSEEHTSELQSQFHLVCRLLLEKKKINNSKRQKSYDTLHPLLKDISTNNNNIP